MSTSTQTPSCNLESCIICKQNTDVYKTQPVSTRNFYVSGVGQMCGCCYMATYNISTAPFFDIDELNDMY